MPYPPVVVVDENDNEIGSAMVAEVWAKGLYHRIVSVFVEDDHGCMLLQRRGETQLLYPGCWDQAAGGHVDEGRSYEQAAATELAEELGLRDVDLKTVTTYRFNDHAGERIINQFTRVYLARVPYDIALQSQPKEVSELRWFTPAELKTQIAANPKAFTPGLIHELRTYFPATLI